MKNLIKRNKCAFTLVEILFAIIIFASVLGGMFQVFIRCSYLSELCKNKQLVLSEVQTKMEEIRNHTYSLITTDYASGGAPGNTFNLTQVSGSGMGIIYIDSSNADRLEVKIAASWLNERDDRVIGEDTDRDGVLDAGEDLNSNGQLDSIVCLTTYIARR